MIFQRKEIPKHILAFRFSSPSVIIVMTIVIAVTISVTVIATTTMIVTVVMIMFDQREVMHPPFEGLRRYLAQLSDLAFFLVVII